MTFEEALEREGVLVYTNKGVSMLPLLRQDRDVLVLHRADRVNPGDAVLFRRVSGQYVLHRILREREGLYYIVGDNCIGGEWVPRERILGVLTSVKRGNREISTEDGLYRLYVRLLPLRRLYLRVRRFGGRVLRFGKRILKKVLRYEG